jgi:hypothetical protein
MPREQPPERHSLETLSIIQKMIVAAHKGEPSPAAKAPLIERSWKAAGRLASVGASGAITLRSTEGETS